MKNKLNKKRVVVAMSGGVDSSVAAWLLKKQGYEVIGITMCFDISHGRRKKPACCGIEGIEDARRVAEKIGIPHYVLNFVRELESQIINNFCREYLKGRTPNPCVRCNQFIKFDALLKKARGFDAEFLATGHYARLVWSLKNSGYILKKGKDKQKDQSYFLYRIKKQVLPYLLFPLGNYTKAQIRVIAKKIGIKVADKPASQEICFIDTNYREFLKTRINANLIKPGPIVDIRGDVIGQHKGICFYTLGQREGLGIALGYRAYIVKIDASKNVIVVGEDKDLFSKELIADKPNFISINSLKKPILAKSRIRYNHKEAPCLVIPLKGNRLKVEFPQPQRAITPGQSVVFYQKDTVLGGAIIQRVL
ncbi:MAG: tRNA 2-thiouridine(34) synthase MnmA [Candidatus Omnitrophica bacterium]|nr:tRNA 2-thiouridine(34) synthase MnmA [Candidatus Omnitrophota bacterium]